MAKQDALSVVASGFAHLMVSQLAIKFVSSLLNLLVARRLSPEAYGVGAVQYHLFLTIILQVSREGFRRSSLRGASDAKDDTAQQPLWQSILRVWVVVPWSVAVTLAVTLVTMALQSKDVSSSIKVGYIMHAAAALLELAAEPLYIVAVQQLRWRLRAGVETAATLARSGGTLALVMAGRWPPALVFSWAQLAFGGVTLGGYGLWLVAMVRQDAGTHAGQQKGSGKGGAKEGAGQQQQQELSRQKERQQYLRLTMLFTLQAAGKLVLAEGSRMVVVAVGSAADQGVYGLVANLGSLVVRILLQPFEEAAFTAFARQQVPRSDTKGLASLGQVLGVLVRAATLLGLLAVSFGPAYSWLLLQLLYGARWSHTAAPAVLSIYCSYVLLLAVNGITEAFVHAVQDEVALQRSSGVLVATSLCHMALTALLATRLGTRGLIMADALNMALRILYSLWYIRGYFKACTAFRLRHLLPSTSTLLLFGVASAATLASERLLMLPHIPAAGGKLPLMPAAQHVAVGVACLGAVAAGMYKGEGPALKAALGARRGGDVGKKDD